MSPRSVYRGIGVPVTRDGVIISDFTETAAG